MFRSFSRSWALAKESWYVLKKTPSLMWFPVVSALVSLLVTASFAVPAVLMVLQGKQVDRLTPLGYAIAACYYFVSYFVVIFFNTALVGCAHENLAGRKARFSDGIGMAARRLPAILGWTLIAATIGTLLRFISERVGIVGQIVVALLGAAWNVVTFLVVPVIVVEQGGPVTSLKRSLAMLKSTWGENLIGTGGIGGATMLLALAPIMPFVLVCMTGSLPLIAVFAAICVLYFVALAIVSSSLTGVYQTALYMYAQNGTTPPGFSQEHVDEAFRSRPGLADRFSGFRR
ncbi:MAG: hypothetical protein JSS66_03875 [Armatimonadetes bacterium]|nr:hypothetical protein [Armatimonadota bacterium]